MPSYDPTLFNVSPYYDDFNEDKKFLRMLFRPGYAVQSRELTQLQTILQNQVERFGNHIFKDGSNIIGGEISTQTLNFVRISPDTISSPIFTASASDLVGHRLIQRDESGNAIAKAIVVDYLPSYSASDAFGVAVVSYMSGTEFTASSTIESDNPSKYMQFTVAPSSTTVPVKGKCHVVAVGEGIYYVNGHFVKSDEQLEAAYSVENEIRNFDTVTGKMGFDVVSTIVTEKDDYTIKDPANGSYNYNAPGAHRYKIDLILKFVETVDQENFIDLVVYSAGTVTRKIERVEYSDIIRLFAQRTYDERGNFVTEPFDISFFDEGNTAYAKVGSGKAYVFGYEYEKQSDDVIQIPQAREKATYTDYPIDNYFGNYITGKYLPGGGNGTIRCNITDLFASVRGPGNSASAEHSLAYTVYGCPTSIGSGQTIRDVAYFEALLVHLEADDPDSRDYSTEGGRTLGYNLYLSNITPLNATGSTPPGGQVALWLYEYSTNTSLRIMNDVTLYKDSFPNSESRLPLFSDYESQSLVFPVNGYTPTTMVEQVSDLSYVRTVFSAFEVVNTGDLPTIPLPNNIGANFTWCKANGYVPPVPEPLTELDGYYIISVDGFADRREGTAIRVVGPNFTVRPAATKVTANIINNGNAIQFTLPSNGDTLKKGSYYLVGTAKNTTASIQTNTSSKIRTKTLVSGVQEQITNGSSTLDTFKRYIRYVGATGGNISEMYFVLDRSDVYAIDSITNSAGVDISDHFQFDNGQRDAVYLLSRLYVKPEHYSKYIPNTTFSIVVNYSYFDHQGYGPFTVDSYLNSGISYDNIPVFVSPRTGETVHLANAMDFRYYAKISGYVGAGATSGTTAAGDPTQTFNRPVVRYMNGFRPEPSSIVQSHRAYLPRIDKLVLSRNIAAEEDNDIGTLKRVPGVPSDSPIVPEDVSDSMTLFTLSVPAYTFNAKDIKAETINNNKFTMKDIGNISSRVDALEEQAVLSDLEMSIITKDINNAAGNDAIKRAIFVDTFDGHSVGDVSDPDYRCSIDAEMGQMRASFTSNAYGVEYTGSDAGITLTTDNILCSNYTGVTLMEQGKASGTLTINPFSLPNWVGSIKISPIGDYWYDNSIRPLVKYNDDGTNDAWNVSNMNYAKGHGSQWNDWESIWNGISVETTNLETNKSADFFAQRRTKQEDSAVELKWNTLSKVSKFTLTLDELKKKNSFFIRKKNYYANLGDNTIINRSIVPSMRAKTVTFSAYNLKPNTQVHVFFDNINVNEYCTKSGSAGPFTTDVETGSLENVTLVIPAGMFETGDKVLRVVDDAGNNIDNATTIAETVFYSRGSNPANPFGLVGIRPAEMRKQTPNSTKVVSNPLYRRKSINTIKYTQWIDPIAQTFEISDNEHPYGTFLESVDLAIATADDELPITVEICPVLNGIPHTSVILPFSTVVKNPAQVTVNSTVPEYTNFKFSTPVYLAPGQYAVVVRANSDKYSLYVANIGKTDIVSEQKITSTFAGGVLYKAQNSSEARGDANTDLMFRLNRCQFSTHSPSVSLNHIVQGTQTFVAHLLQPNLFVFTPSNITLTTKIHLDDADYNATVNRNLQLNTNLTIDETATLDIVVTQSATATLHTFMIDLDRTNIVAVKNLITQNSNNTQQTIAQALEEAPLTGLNDTTARYISKKVSIPYGKTASELRVIFDANIPKGTKVFVYGKTFNGEHGTSQTTGYKLLTVDTANSEFYANGSSYSVNPLDFREITYKLAPTTEKFNTFSVKICMYSDVGNETKVPVIKNLRVVAIE